LLGYQTKCVACEEKNNSELIYWCATFHIYCYCPITNWNLSMKSSTFNTIIKIIENPAEEMYSHIISTLDRNILFMVFVYTVSTEEQNYVPSHWYIYHIMIKCQYNRQSFLEFSGALYWLFLNILIKKWKINQFSNYVLFLTLLTVLTNVKMSP
jgi:hypothetical protein